MKLMYLSYRILSRMCSDLGLRVLPAEAGEQDCNLTGPALRAEKCGQRKREKAPKWDMCNAQRKVSNNSSQEPCLVRGLFTTGQPWWFQTPFLSHNSPEPEAGRWVPHKLRGRTKLRVGFGAQVAPPQAKGLCPEHGSEPLRSENWDLPLLSEQQLQRVTKTPLGLLRNESRELETGKDPQICNSPRESSPSHKSIPKSYSGKLTETCTTIAQSLNQSTSNFLFPRSEVTYTKAPSTLLPVVFSSVLCEPWWVGAHNNYNYFL